MSELTTVFSAIADDVIAAQGELNGLDAVAGDGDLGATMTTAAEAIKALLPELDGMQLGAALKRCGSELARKAPSTSGTLFATALLRAGTAAGQEAAAETPLGGLSRMVTAAIEGIEQRGKAKPGDKTLLDALVPASQALQGAAQAGLGLPAALERAAEAAALGAEATRGMRPRVGRAGWLADRSEGHLDGGAYLVGLLFASAAKAMRAAPS